MKYTTTHQWIKVEGKEATIGISSRLQSELEEIVYVELPKVGHVVKQGEEIAVLESTKAAIDLPSPLSGLITAVNEALRADPSLIRNSPEKAGWILKLKFENASELEELLDAHSYQMQFKN